MADLDKQQKSYLAIAALALFALGCAFVYLVIVGMNQRRIQRASRHIDRNRHRGADQRLRARIGEEEKLGTIVCVANY